MKKVWVVLCLMTVLMQSTVVSAQLVNPVFTPIGGGFDTPLGVRNAGDGSNRLFIIERGGAIRVIDPSDESSSSLFLDISAEVDTFFEGGLLGLAFHPDFQNNGFFYVNYTRSGMGGDALTTVIERYEVDNGDSNIADPNSGVEIITIGQPAGNHNGGDLHFGADGYLYIGMGDGGASDATAQDTFTLLGKMLRINPSIEAVVTTPYTIPASNPFVGSTTLDEIWAFGLRNPYRFSFDQDTGDMLIADVGEGAAEEINFESAASPGGLNYGWDCREGDLVGPGGCSGTFIDPILVYSHAGGNCSVTGGYRYRGVETTWNGSYLYADFCTAKVFIATEDTPGNWSSTELVDLQFSVFGFGESETGRLFYTNGDSVVEINDGDFSDIIFADGFEVIVNL